MLSVREELVRPASIFSSSRLPPAHARWVVDKSEKIAVAIVFNHRAMRSARFDSLRVAIVA